MRSTWLVLGAIAVFSIVLSVSAQSEQTTPQVGIDDFDREHQGLFGSQTDRAAEASRLTEGFAPSGAVAGIVPRKNYIDEAIFGRMESAGISSAPLSSDQEFVRRAYIDAVGLLPSVAEVREFVSNQDPNKRDDLIDSLIGTDAFTDQLAWFYMDLFQARDDKLAYWLKQNFKLDRPYNEIYAELVGGPAVKDAGMIPTWRVYAQASYNALRATTHTDQDNYYYANRLDWIDEVTVNLGRVFLGINMDCFSCHDGAGHTDSLNLFLTSKTREEFHRQAAFFGLTRHVDSWSDQSRMPSSGNPIIDDSGPGYTTGNDAPFHTLAESRFPRSGATYEPAFILTGEEPRPGENPRRELGRIVPDHIQFSRAAANLIWGKLMVVGFVEPYDGFDLLRLDPENPPPEPWTVQPSNPELLETMAQDFKANDYSLQHLFRTIMKSSAYQLSTQFPGEWEEAYVPYYARRFVRVLTGPEVADAIAQATGQPYSFTLGGQTVTTVKELSNPSRIRSAGSSGGATGRLASISQSNFSDGQAIAALMQSFFQSGRETPPPSANRPSATQAMMMMSSPAVTNRLAPDSGLLGRLLTSDISDADVTEELFLTALSRTPTPEEVEVAERILEDDREQGASDILWALLNTPEFLLNH